ncbi:putative thiosulfate sulfurtransferase [Pelotomaculum schinkii]|uniref:thiosulfate sulfurtransferase n=1 Tax=Pelotomaculum schinkii TaxID=78350 RepID=A0A4Y7RF83_9FIRM|nr:rhodanese-like domain-containing protein [Pelotomaculum schinkii]TEB07431.1 putative thiosulfate sulfurtransferase [Pelotomaculum schinkii]
MWKKFKYKQLLVALIAMGLVLGASGCGKQPAPVDKQDQKEFDISVYQNNDFLMTPQKLQAMLGSEELVLLDCNKPDVYAAGHIPGAIGIGINAFSDTSGKIGDPGWGTVKNKEDLQKKLESLGIDNKKTVVFYSDVFKGPGADGRAVWQLKLAGMDNVKMLVGGLSYWKEMGYEVTKEAAQPKPVTGVVLKNYDQSFIATKDYVFNNLDKQVLVDVRTEGEFKGSQNAGEPRGGHIKGAVNLLWQELLNKDGTIKTPEEIKTLMASYNVKPADDFIVY